MKKYMVTIRMGDSYAGRIADHSRIVSLLKAMFHDDNIVGNDINLNKMGAPFIYIKCSKKNLDLLLEQLKVNIRRIIPNCIHYTIESEEVKDADK